VHGGCAHLEDSSECVLVAVEYLLDSVVNLAVVGALGARGRLEVKGEKRSLAVGGDDGTLQQRVGQGQRFFLVGGFLGFREPPEPRMFFTVKRFSSRWTCGSCLRSWLRFLSASSFCGLKSSASST
jgi:hypothetical protein